MRRFFFVLACAAALSAAAAAQSSSISTANVALFDEVWSTVNDNYYDPTFGGVDWAGVRNELRPKAAAAPSMDAARVVVTEMLGRLKKSHFALMAVNSSADDEMVVKGEATVDIEFRIVGQSVVVTETNRQRRYTTGDLAPLMRGSRILSIDGKSMTPKAGESPLVSWRRVNAALHGAIDSRVEFVHIPPVEKTPLNTPRTTSEFRTLPAGQVMQFSNLPPMRVKVEQREERTSNGARVGYIAFNLWMTQINAPVAKAIDTFRDHDGLVIDLRGNPGGLAAMISNLAGQIIATPELLGTMKTKQIPQLKFVVNPRTSTDDGRTVKPFSGPVAIIVDEMTASASECFAGALQDLGRARIFGRTSMGAALPASTKRLSNGDVLEYVVGDFVTSKGRSLEGSGVVPDEIQPLSIASLSAGNDDPLKAALAWIDRQPRGGR